MMNYVRGVLGAGLAVLALSIFAMPVNRASAECSYPRTCTEICTNNAGYAKIEDPEEKADYINTCKFVNCDSKGYFHGAMDLYYQCLDNESAERAAQRKKEEELAKKAEGERIIERDSKRAEIEKKGKSFVTKMKFGTDVKAGETIRANRHETVVIDYADGSRFVLEPGSSMKIHSDYYVYLSKGKFRLLFKKIKTESNKKFEVRTPTAGGAVRGTEFMVEVKAVNTTFKLFEGSLEVSNLKGDKKLILEPGYSVVVRKSGAISKPKAFDAEKVKRWEEPQAENPNE